MLERLSEWVLRRPRAILLAALLLSAVGVVASSTLSGKLLAGGFDAPDSESQRARTQLGQVFGRGQPNLVVLVTTPDGVDVPAATAAGTALTARLAAEPGVANTTSYWSAGREPSLRSADGDEALIVARITGNDTQAQERVAELAARYQGSVDGLGVEVGGYTLLQRELVEQSQEGVTTAETVAFPILLVVLVLVFGSVVAASLPLLVAALTVLLCVCCMWVLASATGLSPLALSVVTLLGLGLAIDYGLLLVSRYREELRTRGELEPAIRATVRSAGRTVAFSALMVAVSTAALAWFPLPAVRSMAFAGAATAILAALASLIVLPALLAVLGPRIEKWRLFPDRRTEQQVTAVDDTFWHRLATFAMRRPVPIATAVTVVLLLLGVPFVRIDLGVPDERVLSESSVARQVATTVDREFDGSERDVLRVVVPYTGGDGAALEAYAAALSGVDAVASVDTATGTYVEGAEVAPPGARSAGYRSGEAVWLAVVPTADDPEDAARLVAELRSVPAPFETLVGGAAAHEYDAVAVLQARLPHALASVAVVMLVLLFLVTGSLLLPLLALVLSALSLTAAFGALVWIFQDGHLAGLLGFTPTGSIATVVPVMLFGVSFGLAMDYQVFLLSRMREEYERSGSATAAIARGLARTGAIVTAAAIAISIVFLAFVASPVSLVKAFGVGLPLVVLMDATLVRGALLPAAMRLGGRATWWAPEPLRRLHSRLGVRDEVPEAPRRPVAVG